MNVALVQRLAEANVIKRTLSSVVLIPLTIWLVWTGGIGFYLFTLAASGLMAYEWGSICLTNAHHIQKSRRRQIVGLYIGLQLAATNVLLLISQPLQSLVVLIVLACLIFLKTSALRLGHRNWWIIGTIWVPFACASFYHLRQDFVDGLPVLVWILAVVWATDTGAFFAGRLIGGPKLAPRISPKKTWAGLIGGAVSAMVAVFLVQTYCFPSAALPFWGYAALLAVVSQMGDLTESSFKRCFNVKDSGRLIPGHGGILDRVDGLMAALPVYYLVMWWLNHG